MSDNVFDLETERDRRLIEDMNERIRNRKPFKVELDVEKIQIHIAGYSASESEPHADILRLVIYNVSNPDKIEPVGALAITRTQWEQMKKVGDGLLNFRNKTRELESHDD